MNDAHRTEDQALKALARHRRDQARERSEPPRLTHVDTSTPTRQAAVTTARPAIPTSQTNPSSTPKSSTPAPTNPPPAAAHPPASGPAAA
jgi:hypothetical protein